MIEVRENQLGKAVYAARYLEEGLVIFRGQGERIARRSRHSIQIDHDTHIVIDAFVSLLNHSCEPNSGVIIRSGNDVVEFRTLRPLAAGEELTIDYATFELEIQYMDGPCLCGAASCRGRITGYRALPAERRAALAPYIAEYLTETASVVSQAG
jgi:uncharacterized protein